MKKVQQNTTRNNSGGLIEINEGFPDQISFWAETYFEFEVSTGEDSRKVQKRDLELFVNFMQAKEGRDERAKWTPRVSQESGTNRGLA